jgi:hypothetical protein
MKTKMGAPTAGKVKPGKIPQAAAKDKEVPRSKSLGISPPKLMGGPDFDGGDSVRLEEIENGYLTHHTKIGPSKMEVKTVFHPEKPSITVGHPKLHKKRT